LALDIVIPVFNERSISKLLALIGQNVKCSFRVLICHDTVDDITLKSYQAENYNFPILNVLSANPIQGPHGAITTGFDFATSDAVLVYPADDYLNTGIIDRMYDLYLEGCDVVVASRFIKGGSMKNCPPLKSLLVRLGSYTLYSFSCIPVLDASNGFRLFSRRYLRSITIESTQGFTYSIELLVKARRMRLAIGEVPARWEERSEGESRFNISSWLLHYLKWYFYGLATFWLRKRLSCPYNIY